MRRERSTAGGRKRGRPTEDERGERKELILDTAVALFIENGYALTTVDQLAAECQVTKRTIYTYFGDKADVFEAAVQRLHARVVDGSLADGQPERLDRLATRIVQTLHSAEAIGLHRLVIAEAPRFPALAAAFYAAGPEQYIHLLTTALATNSGRSTARRQAEGLFTLLLGESHRRRLLGLDGSPSPAQARAHARRALDLLDL